MYKHISLILTKSIITFFLISTYIAMAAQDKDINQSEKQSLAIYDAWARKSLSSNSNSAAYMKINNPTNRSITIVGASASKIANNVELHKSFVDDKGISRMTSIDKIVVPAQSEIELKPGGIHIMLFDLKNRLITGNQFTINVKTEEGKIISFESIVK